jgi:hypothetical protein
VRCYRAWPACSPTSGLAGALRFSTGHAAHVVCGGTLFALGAAGVGLQGWHAVEWLRGGRQG